MPGNSVTTAEFNRIYFAVERVLYPDQCPGAYDARVIRTTREVLRVLGIGERRSAKCS